MGVTLGLGPHHLSNHQYLHRAAREARIPSEVLSLWRRRKMAPTS
jgi:hypothetical protein